MKYSVLFSSLVWVVVTGHFHLAASEPFVLPANSRFSLAASFNGENVYLHNAILTMSDGKKMILGNMINGSDYAYTFFALRIDGDTVSPIAVKIPYEKETFLNVAVSDNTIFLFSCHVEKEYVTLIERRFDGQKQCAILGTRIIMTNIPRAEFKINDIFPGDTQAASVTIAQDAFIADGIEVSDRLSMPEFRFSPDSSIAAISYVIVAENDERILITSTCRLLQGTSSTHRYHFGKNGDEDVWAEYGKVEPDNNGTLYHLCSFTEKGVSRLFLRRLSAGASELTEYTAPKRKGNTILSWSILNNNAINSKEFLCFLSNDNILESIVALVCSNTGNWSVASAKTFEFTPAFCKENSIGKELSGNFVAAPVRLSDGGILCSIEYIKPATTIKKEYGGGKTYSHEYKLLSHAVIRFNSDFTVKWVYYIHDRGMTSAVPPYMSACKFVSVTNPISFITPIDKPKNGLYTVELSPFNGSIKAVTPLILFENDYNYCAIPAERVVMPDSTTVFLSRNKFLGGNAEWGAYILRERK